MTGVILMIVALILAGLLLLAVELCTPTFGVLAIAGVLCLGGGVYLCFTINPVAGLGSVLGLIILVPLWLWASVPLLGWSSALCEGRSDRLPGHRENLPWLL